MFSKLFGGGCGCGLTSGKNSSCEVLTLLVILFVLMNCGILNCGLDWCTILILLLFFCCCFKKKRCDCDSYDCNC
ncbi:MAG: hypothetical protein IJ301_02790 [Clostridia bacterium]|nr:hypothetical protein [Clostridia bacterium]